MHVLMKRIPNVLERNPRVIDVGVKWKAQNELV